MKKAVYLKCKKKKIDLNSYAGNWVALLDDKPIACDENLDLLMQKIKKKQHLAKAPSVMLVPRSDEGPYILRELGEGF